MIGRGGMMAQDSEQAAVFGLWQHNQSGDIYAVREWADGEMVDAVGPLFHGDIATLALESVDYDSVDAAVLGDWLLTQPTHVVDRAGNRLAW